MEIENRMVVDEEWFVPEDDEYDDEEFWDKADAEADERWLKEHGYSD